MAAAPELATVGADQPFVLGSINSMGMSASGTGTSR